MQTQVEMRGHLNSSCGHPWTYISAKLPVLRDLGTVPKESVHFLSQTSDYSVRQESSWERCLELPRLPRDLINFPCAFSSLAENHTNLSPAWHPGSSSHHLALVGHVGMSWSRPSNNVGWTGRLQKIMKSPSGWEIILLLVKYQWGWEGCKSGRWIKDDVKGVNHILQWERVQDDSCVSGSDDVRTKALLAKESNTSSGEDLCMEPD